MRAYAFRVLPSLPRIDVRAALAEDANRPPVEVDVVQVEPAQFRYPDSGGVEQFEHGLIAQQARGIRARVRFVLSAYATPSERLAAWARVPHARRADEARRWWSATLARGAAFSLGDTQADIEEDPLALRHFVDRLMYEIKRLSGQEYRDQYAGKRERKPETVAA